MSSRRVAFRLSILLGLGITVAGIAGFIGSRVLLRATPEDLTLRLVVMGIGYLLIAVIVGWGVWRLVSRRVDWGRVQNRTEAMGERALGKSLAQNQESSGGSMALNRQ